MYKETIGIVGGFGGFATLDFYRRLLETFFTGYERDYPHITMDNDYTMPSRTRGLLYDECIDQITEMIAVSIKKLITIGADKIVLPCGTAHWYLDGVYDLLPEAKNYVVDMIDSTGKKLQSEGVTSCYVIAAEGTMLKKLYNHRLEKFGITVQSPEECDWQKVRYFIESTKQNRITPEVKQEFGEFVLKHVEEIEPGIDKKVHVILGCTELPPLVNDDTKKTISFEDPLECVLASLKRDLK